MERLPARAPGSSRVIFVTLAMVAALVASTLATDERSASAGSYGFSGAERCLMHKVNHARRRHGLRRLRHDKQIGYVARRHARNMAGTGYVWDDGALGTKVTRWRSLGQNSGYGRRCGRLFKEFMRSLPHRRNILGHYHFMGVGTSRHNGRLYSSQVFEGRHNPGNVYHYP